MWSVTLFLLQRKTAKAVKDAQRMLILARIYILNLGKHLQIIIFISWVICFSNSTQTNSKNKVLIRCVLHSTIWILFNYSFKVGGFPKGIAFTLTAEIIVNESEELNYWRPLACFVNLLRKHSLCTLDVYPVRNPSILSFCHVYASRQTFVDMPFLPLF